MGQSDSRIQVSEARAHDTWPKADSDADEASYHGDLPSDEYEAGDSKDGDQAVASYQPGDRAATSEVNICSNFGNEDPRFHKMSSDIEAARTGARNGGTILDEYRQGLRLLTGLTKAVSEVIARYEPVSFRFSRKSKERFEEEMGDLKAIEDRLITRRIYFLRYPGDTKMDCNDFILLLDIITEVISDVPKSAAVLETIATNKRQARSERIAVADTIIRALGSWVPKISIIGV